MRSFLIRRPSRLAAALGVGVILGSVGIASVVVADRAGCSDAAAAPITESAKFIPYEERRTKTPDSMVGDSSKSAALPARASYATEAIDGNARRYTIDSPNGSVYSYFLDRDTTGMMLSEFVKSGGLQLHQDLGNESFAAYLLKAFPDRAVPVKIGTFDGALTWADPDENGIRTHNLYWFDGTYNHALIGDRPAAALVNLGRQLACG